MNETETFVGCCEMETSSWACSNTDTLTGTYVRPSEYSDNEEYRFVCAMCRQKYGN